MSVSNWTCTRMNIVSSLKAGSLVECIRFPKRCRIESISIVPASVSAFQSPDVIGQTTDTHLDLQCLIHFQSEPLSKRGVLPLKKIILHYNPSDIHGQNIAMYVLKGEEELFTRFIVLKSNKPAVLTLAMFGDVSKSSVQIEEETTSIDMISSRHEKLLYIPDSFRGAFYEERVERDRHKLLDELVKSLHFDDQERGSLLTQLCRSRNDGNFLTEVDGLIVRRFGRDDVASHSKDKARYTARQRAVADY